MFHVHSSCISNMKNIKGNIQPEEVSVVNTELSLKVKRVMLMIFSIDLVQYETQHLHFKVFLAIYISNLDGCQKEGVTFKICFRKRGVPRKGEGVPQKRRGRGVPTLEETMFLLIVLLTQIILILRMHELQLSQKVFWQTIESKFKDDSVW